MKCVQAKSLFSPYLDGALSGRQMHALCQHLAECGPCAREYAELRQTHQLLTGVGRKKAPADLALRLRVAISQAVAQSRRPRFQGMLVRLENVLNAFMVPATAGLISTVVIFGIVMGFLALPQQLQGSNDDVPLLLYTAPELQQSAFSTSLGAISEDSLVIEADVDASGRVLDYHILSDPKTSQDLLPQVKNMLIFTTFRPATALGRPTPGKAVLSFSKISVRG